MKKYILTLGLIALAQFGSAGELSGVFPSIDGGNVSIEDWRGQPVLVVNTASQCAFTPQYEALQSVYDTYRARGLVVLAVPSDDFNQELEDAAAVKEFCTLTYGLDLPMTDITHVRGNMAHPFFKQVRDQTGFEPAWNFNKILVGPDGNVVATWGSAVRPDSPRIRASIENLLN